MNVGSNFTGVTVGDTLLAILLNVVKMLTASYKVWVKG